MKPKNEKQNSWEEEFEKILNDSTHEIGVGYRKEKTLKDFIRQTLKESKLALLEEISEDFKFVPDDLDKDDKHYYSEKTINDFFDELKKEVEEM